MNRFLIKFLLTMGLVACSQTPTKPEQLMAQGRRDFSTHEQRSRQSDAYVAHFDEVIKLTGFGDLLECREKWIAKEGNSYKVKYVDQGIMSVNREPVSERDLVLVFNIASPYTDVLLTYMHELVHVCQASQRDLLFDQAVQNKDWSDYNRYALLGEVEAFLLMKRAYEKLVLFDSQMSRGEGGKDLGLMYAEMTKEIEKGIFGERVLSWYKSHYSQNFEGLFAPKGAIQDYPASPIGPAFSLPALHPLLIEGLQKLGVRVR